MKDGFKYELFKKVYEKFYHSAPPDKSIRNQIQKDVIRTFSSNYYFNQEDVQESLKRMLVTYAHYEGNIGYV